MRVRVSLKELSEALDRVDFYNDEAVTQAELRRIGSRAGRELVLHFNTDRIIELDVESVDHPRYFEQDSKRWWNVSSLLNSVCKPIKDDEAFPDRKVDLEIFKNYLNVVFKY